MNMSARIWTTFERGGNHGGEYRELENVSRNERGDFVFTLDGGERWQFTPHNQIAPTVENVKQLGIGKDGKTGKPSMLAFLILTSGEKCVGNLRIFPPATDSKVEDAIAAIARALPGSARPTKEKLVKIGDKYWPLEKIVCYDTGAGPEGEPPKTREGLDKWQRGPKVWRWNELLQFRGFRVWLSITEKECPELAESIRDGTQFIPGPVEEITPPDMARFQFAGGVKVRLTVEKYSAEGAPPLSPEEIKAAGEIIDALEGREKQTATRKGGRKIKDPRPLPPRDFRGRNIRGQYSSKIRDLLPVEHSNRTLAKKVIAWARKQGDGDPTGFGQWKLLGESVLAKEAGKLRKDWAKERVKRRKG